MIPTLGTRLGPYEILAPHGKGGRGLRRPRRRLQPARLLQLSRSGRSVPPQLGGGSARAELDPGIAEAHTSLGYTLHYHDWDWEASEREYLRGMELNPAYPQGPLWYLNLLSSQGRFDEALVQASRCRELDPLAVICATAEGWVRYLMRDFDGSIAVIRKALELDRNSGPGHLWCASPYIEKGLFEEAFQELEAARGIFGDAVVRLTFAFTYARAGDRARARETLDQALAQRGQRHVPAYLVAIVMEELGEHGVAWEWLERAVAERDHWLVFLGVEPRFDGFRDDPRFAEVKRKVGVQRPVPRHPPTNRTISIARTRGVSVDEPRRRA